MDPSSLFGSRADMPVMKERSLGPATYLLFALSGAVGCAMTHSVVIPIDVVKVRQGSSARREGGRASHDDDNLSRVDDAIMR